MEINLEFIFLNLLNKSIAAGYLILAVILFRFVLKKAPKRLICLFWGIAAIRLICPFSFESIFSLIPSRETISRETVQFSETPAVNSGIPIMDQTLNPIIGESFSPAPGASVNPLHVLLFIAGILWAAGVAVMLLYGIFSCFRLLHTVRESIILTENIYLCDAIRSPFLLGVFRPRIYLPFSMEGTQQDYVIAHEKAHLARKDHWWKTLGYLLLSVYWFHPLCWAAYILFCRDIELACDESVVKDLNLTEKKGYSNALLSCSTQKETVIACPLAFGEVGIKSRVKSILHYKKPTVWIIGAAAAAGIVLALCFLTDPADPSNSKTLTGTVSAQGNNENPSDAGTDKPSDPDNTDADAAVTGEAIPDADAVQAAITDAVMKHNLSHYSDDYDFACCSFATLEKNDSSTPLRQDTEQTHTVTYYGWAMYQEYKISEKGLENTGGSHIPTVLTFEGNGDEYNLKEYWEPRDGSYYVSDIREKFPEHLAADGIDSQKYVLAQIQDCYKQAVQYSNLDTDAVIGSLIDTICSSPSASSNPYDYINEHSIEYRELLYYNTYTYRYCMEHLKQDGETGLKGRIMSIVCEELSQGFHEEPL